MTADVRELVERLAPESPLLFARARLLLRDTAPGAVARFAVGRPVPGSWTVLHDGGWQTVHGEDPPVRHDTARSAIAHAVGGLLADEGLTVNSELLRTAGLVQEGPYNAETNWSDWGLTETAQRIWDATDNAPRPSSGEYIALGSLLGRRYPSYFVVASGPAPAHGPFVSTHDIFTRAAHNELPDGPSEPPETLPEGTVLDSYGDTDQVFLYEEGTPFHKRGLPGEPWRYPHRRYELRKPLDAYPAFPFERTTVPLEKAGGEGRGYYLVDTIADLLASGHLAALPNRAAFRAFSA
ncbi:glycohydrolase toxin TNT-related protein [Actinomadura fibrosa]|uniref:Glycohydrolase toxin TNT-related protein n=1 Tax=Actinomadura fibrosa TaxID=111802 RepID=A0ABW2Y088_9ACTN|nr:glycohydrolase toxin TNT-related protein [Actinomadura fibrosa]